MRNPPTSPLPAPLWAVQTIAFLSSIGTAVVQHGIYFMIEHRFHVGSDALFGLGLLFGLAYLPSALFISPALSRFEARHAWCTPRMVLAAVLVGMATVAALPLIAAACGFDAQWVWWVVFAGYAVLSGTHWPILEAFLSGGRRQRTLRAATGQFNVIWAGAMAISFVGMKPLVENHQFLLMGLMAAIHLLTPLFLLACPSAPPVSHLPQGESHPPAYARLLGVFRILLPTSYLVSGTLIPYFPAALERLGVTTARAVGFIAVWHLARVAAFAAMERWHGWHGRWATPIVGVALMLGGFAGCVLAPTIGGGFGRAAFVASLVPFGLGMGVIYAGAIYYAMEVGHSKVEASGAHESLIGLGMTIGPLCGLLVVGAERLGILPSAASEGALLGLVMVFSLCFGGVAVRSSWKHARGESVTRPIAELKPGP